MTLRPSLALVTLVAVSAAAQTATTPAPAKKTTTTQTHRRTATTAAKSPAKPATQAATTPAPAAPVMNPADNPPNVPKVEGMPQSLYALRYIDTQIGTGELAKSRQYYTVHYTGWLPDGTKFDSSHDHPGGEPIVFPYGARQVIAGWDTGFEGMRVGGKRRLYIPWQLAYGETGRPPVIPAKADLIFDLELVSQSESLPQQPESPANGSQPNQ
ncbi:MAG TPA: FKBP-type peptidyl-prolyl cis-trans isomerase [Edaphobacter sp.]